MKFFTVLIVGLMTMITTGPAIAGPVDWCFNQFGYTSEKALMETASKLEVAKTEIRLLSQFNEKLQSMLTSANLTALGSFGVAFLLAGIFIDKIRKSLRNLWQKVVYKFKPTSAETATEP
jgi:hypothetical protein